MVVVPLNYWLTASDTSSLPQPSEHVNRLTCLTCRTRGERWDGACCLCVFVDQGNFMRRYRRDTRYIRAGTNIRIDEFFHRAGDRRNVLSQHVAGRSETQERRPICRRQPSISCATAKWRTPGTCCYERLPGFHLSDVGVRMAQATAHYIAVKPAAEHRIRRLLVAAGTHARNGRGDPRIAEFGT